MKYPIQFIDVQLDIILKYLAAHLDYTSITEWAQLTFTLSIVIVVLAVVNVLGNVIYAICPGTDYDGMKRADARMLKGIRVGFKSILATWILCVGGAATANLSFTEEKFTTYCILLFGFVCTHVCIWLFLRRVK